MQSLYTAKNRIEQLKKRANRCVCKYCGSPLQLKRVIFNDIKDARVEIFCESCDKIEFGVEPAIYQSACNFVENLEFNYYEDMSQNELTYKMNVAKVCEILAWGCKDLGLIDQDGFRVEIDKGASERSECLILTSEQIDEDKGFENYLEALL